MRLLLTLIPRGERTSTSQVLQVDDELVPSASLSVPIEWYLGDGADELDTRFRHARGMAPDGDGFWLTLFNSIVRVDTTNGLESASIGRRLSHPHAADLRAVCSTDAGLASVACGTDAVLRWSSGDHPTAESSSLVPVLDREYRFPQRLENGDDDSWRDFYPRTLHLNGLSTVDDAFVVSSPGSLFVLDQATLERRFRADDDRSLWHDPVPVDEGVFVSNAATGSIEHRSDEMELIREFSVADPTEWFVRGLSIVGNLAVVGHSRRLPNRTLRPRPGPAGDPSPSKFAVAVVNTDSGVIEARSEFEVSDPGMALSDIVALPD